MISSLLSTSDYSPLALSTQPLRCGLQTIKTIYYHTINCSGQVAYAVFIANKLRIYCNVCTQRADYGCRKSDFIYQTSQGVISTIEHCKKVEHYFLSVIFSEQVCSVIRLLSDTSHSQADMFITTPYLFLWEVFSNTANVAVIVCMNPPQSSIHYFTCNHKAVNALMQGGINQIVKSSTVQQLKTEFSGVRDCCSFHQLQCPTTKRSPVTTRPQV